jgi:GNAT superfamily N-acetyltransferase
MELDQLRFEEATPEDALALARVSERAFHSDVHYGAPGSRPGGPPGYRDDRWQTRMMMGGDYFKILLGGSIVGGIVVRLRGYRHYEVARVFVDPAVQNQGIGTRTFAFLWRQYPDVGLWTLGTPAWNTRTPGFYRKVGFVQVGEDGRGGLLFERRLEEA